MFRPPQPQQPRRAMRQGQIVPIRLPEPAEVTTLIVGHAKQFAVRHKYLTAWYLLGLVVLGVCCITAGRSLSPDQANAYHEIMGSIDVQAEYDATDAYWQANQRYRTAKGWFWSCDGTCQRAKSHMELARSRLDAVRAEGNARMSDAKAMAGLSSEIAVSEIKDSFWQYYASGKRFAKRQTGWDIVWMMIRSVHRGRDESWAEYAAKILLHLLINFTMGLLSALAFFVLGLWNILRSYQPNPATALLVFLTAAAGATSFVVSYLFALTGAAAGGVYGLAKMAEHSQRAQIAAQRNMQRLHQD